MALMASLRINVMEIDKTRLFSAKKGKKYLNLTVLIDDKTDDYGNNVSCWEEQSKEERLNKEHRNFLSSAGKVFWESDGNSNSSAGKVADTQPVEDEKPIEEDDIPF